MANGTLGGKGKGGLPQAQPDDITQRSLSEFSDEDIFREPSAGFLKQNLISRQNLEDERARRRRRTLIQSKPGFAATILTQGFGLDDDDNVRRPTLLGG